MLPSRRKNYSFEFKRQALKKLQENDDNISDTAKKIGIDRKNLQRWKKDAMRLNSASLLLSVNSRTRKRFRQRKALYPLVEDSIVEFIKEKRSRRQSVTSKMIRNKALLIFPDLYPDVQNFKAAHGWMRKMLKRNNLSFRRVTSVGQKIPHDAPEICDAFLREMQSLNLKRYDVYLNMDETPCYFDIPRKSTIEFKGVTSVKVKTTGNERLRFTAVLTAGVRRDGDTYKGFRMPPMLVFKNLTKPPKGIFPPGMVVLGSKGGSMTRLFMKEYFIPRVMKKRPGGFFNNGETLFLMDSATCHENLEKEFEAINVDCKLIPIGMTPLLQFCDTHVNKPFKDALKEEWEKWIDVGEKEITPKGNRRRASYTLVAEWVDKSWKKVAALDFIVKGFKQCGYIDYNGDLDRLHSRLQDTITSRSVPVSLIEEINAFLEQEHEEKEELCEVSEGENDDIDVDNDGEENSSGDGDGDDYVEDSEGDIEVDVVGDSEDSGLSGDEEVDDDVEDSVGDIEVAEEYDPSVKIEVENVVEDSDLSADEEDIEEYDDAIYSVHKNVRVLIKRCNTDAYEICGEIEANGGTKDTDVCGDRKVDDDVAANSDLHGEDCAEERDSFNDEKIVHPTEDVNEEREVVDLIGETDIEENSDNSVIDIEDENRVDFYKWSKN